MQILCQETGQQTAGRARPFQVQGMYQYRPVSNGQLGRAWLKMTGEYFPGNGTLATLADPF